MRHPRTHTIAGDADLDRLTFFYKVGEEIDTLSGWKDRLGPAVKDPVMLEWTLSFHLLTEHSHPPGQYE
jgi:hypothetical protein